MIIQGQGIDARSIPGLLITGVFGVVSTLIPLIDAWMQRKGTRKQTEAEIDLATKEVAFWKTWLDAQSAFMDDPLNIETKHIALENMISIARRQEARGEAALRELPPIAYRERPLLTRIFLLYTPRYAAWFPRILYYAFSMEFAYGFVTSLGDGSLAKPWTNVIAALNLVLILIFRASAIQIEESRRKRAASTKQLIS